MISERERSVLQTMFETGCQKKTALTLGITGPTVKNHLANMDQGETRRPPRTRSHAMIDAPHRVGLRCASVPGYEKLYAIYSDGKVWSLGRVTIGGSRGGACMKTYKAREMKFRMDSGYARVRLTNWSGTQTQWNVSTLMKMVGFCRRSAERPIDRKKKFRDRSVWRHRKYERKERARAY